MKSLLSLLFTVALVSCKRPEMISPNTVELGHRTYNQVITSLDASSLESAVQVPNEDGALGRNKEAYFHVRFQLGLNTLSDLAIAEERLDALDAVVRTIQYSFTYQLADGGFELSIPEELSHLGAPLEAELVSGTAFFGSSLGLALWSLSNSEWFQESATTASQKTIIQSYIVNFQRTLNYLKEHKETLLEIDKEAPNRLLFDAVAFQSLGRFLSDQEALDIAEDFAELALELQDDSVGYFIEGGGWDSSYNGVALQLGMELFMIMEDSTLRVQLQRALQKSVEWQLSRILDSGEISQEGNTRVFDGGEAFLGEEKGVDYAKTAKSFIYLSVLANDTTFRDVAERILEFYM